MQETPPTRHNLEAALQRFPHPTLVALVHNLNLPTGRGKLGMVEAIMDEFDSTLIQNMLPRLLDIYREHILYADKAIRIYREFPTDAVRILRDQLATYSVPDNVFVQYWSMPMPSASLQGVGVDDAIQLVDIITEDLCTHMIYSTVRIVTQESTFTPDAFGDDRPDFTDRFETFIGVEHIRRQCFDVITIYDNGDLDFKVDCFKGENRHLGKQDQRTHIGNLLDNFQSILSTVFPSSIQWPQPLNFYPAIANLIEHDTEITISRIEQSDNQLCNANFSRRRRNDDVRDATVYRGGNAGLVNQGDRPRSHSLRARSCLNYGSKEHYPELIIESTPVVHHVDTPSVHTAIIKFNIGREDFYEMRNKLLNNL